MAITRPGPPGDIMKASNLSNRRAHCAIGGNGRRHLTPAEGRQGQWQRQDRYEYAKKP